MVNSKLTNMLRLLRAACSCSPNEALLAERFGALARARAKATPDAPLLVVAPLPDAAYYAILGEIVSGLRARLPLRTTQVCTQALRHGASQSLRHFLRARLDFNSLTQRKWESLYAIFCDRVAYRSVRWASPPRAARQWRKAWRIWRGLRDKEQLAALSYQGIVIGDLVIDSYLRLRPTKAVELDDLYLLVVIHQALKEVELAFDYFRSARPDILVTVYTAYVQLGVPTRVALACGTRVLTFGNLQEFATPATPARPSHTRDSSGYSIEFNALPGPATKVAQAAHALEARLSGNIDAATSYMKRSAYAVTTRIVPDVRGATVVFLHDFYDSLHIYSWVLFHDFWEWACFTIETLQAAGCDFWIKPHPNQGEESSSEIEALRRKYPRAKFLATDVTNRQLANAGMARAVTVYGSVAPEMGFLGIPSLSSGDSPHASFDAFQLARTREDYAALLAQPPTAAVDIKRLKAQACAFYYMHNLNLDGHGTLLRDRFAAVWAHLFALQANGCFDETKTFSVLSDLTENPAFQHFADTLLSTPAR